jgi:hypothetical protein
MVDKDNCWLTTDIDEELPYLRITPLGEEIAKGKQSSASLRNIKIIRVPGR